MEQWDDLRVYLIDDEVLIVESLAHLLKEHLGEKALVRFFTSPARLMEAFEQLPCDLLISDIRMPGMTGLELLSHLNGLCEDFETIFLTGYDMFEYAYQSIQENAFGYLLKNESDERVLEVVDRALEKIQARRALERRVNAAPREEPDSAQLPAVSAQESEAIRLRRVSEQVKAYIAQHMGDDLTTASIAAQVGYSEAHLSRLFKESEGVTLHLFIQQARMERACRMLQSTHEKIYRIAQACGYNNTAYFIRTFKSVMGITPQQFRYRQTGHS